MGSTVERFWILRSPIFLVSLGLLLANDLYLKAAYPGWLTGKLSDFSGLLMFALFLFPLCRASAARVASGIALCFIWWKSPYSSSVIGLINDTGLIAIGRVVDYSDLIALVVLPFAVRFYNEGSERVPDTDLWRRLSLIPVLTLTVMAITGTSRLLITRPVEISPDEGTAAISEAEVDAIVVSLFNSRKDECRERDETSRRRTCFIDGVWFEYLVHDAGVRFEFEQAQSSKRAIADVNRLLDSIKVAFAAQTEGFTYVEPLLDPEELQR